MGNKILDQAQIDRITDRLAIEIVERNYNAEKLILAGIAPNGDVLSRILKAKIALHSNIEVSIITVKLDKQTPKEVEVVGDKTVNDQVVIIVDDVSMTGRTICYALKPFLDQYPKSLQTLVLVERELKQFPINSNYVGIHISTTLHELIEVETQNGEIVAAYLN